MLIKFNFSFNTDSHLMHSTDCSHTALGNLQYDVHNGQRHLLMLPGWFTHDKADLITTMRVL